MMHVALTLRQAICSPAPIIKYNHQPRFMSLLNFFTQQRNRWRSQATDKSSDYVAGGLTALYQAELAFKATTLYNVQQRVAATQDELEEVSHQLVQARRTISRLEAIIAVVKQQTVEVPEGNQTRSAREILRKVVITASYLPTSPENKLRRVLKLINESMAPYKEGVEGGKQPEDA
jgi:phage shock protein A